MYSYIKISIGILALLSLTRFIPHPPNFTSLIALSFYVPIIFGIKFLPILLLSFVFTDLFIGFHTLTFFTWGSICVIALISKYFSKTLISRFTGAISGALIFFIISNLGVWLMGSYGYTLNGFIKCYILAIPFFGNTLVSTIIYSFIFEILYKYSKTNNFNNFLINLFSK